MISLREAKVGQRLSFFYYGGSNPGDKRLVDVTEVLSDRIIGTDVDKDNIRSFVFDKASCIQIVTPTEKVGALDENQRPRIRRTQMSFEDARVHLHNQIDSLTGEDLAQVLAEIDGHDAHSFDSDTGSVVMETMVLEPYCQPVASGGTNWVNEDGDFLHVIHIATANKALTEVDGEDVSPEECVKKIAEHLGLTIE